jgi:hypothetical protein
LTDALTFIGNSLKKFPVRLPVTSPCKEIFPYAKTPKGLGGRNYSKKGGKVWGELGREDKIWKNGEIKVSVSNV